MEINDLKKCLSVMSKTCKELLKAKDNKFALDDAYAIGDAALTIANYWSADNIADEFEWI